MRLAFQYHNTRNSTYYQSRSQRLRRAPFGATFDGREYVRDTGDDLVAFHKGHERAHNRAALEEIDEMADNNKVALSEHDMRDIPFDAEIESRNYDIVTDMESVCKLEGNEFAKGDENLVNQVDRYFQSFGGSVESEELGTILLSRQDVKSSVGHGIGRMKSIAFHAVLDVLHFGKALDYQQNRKDRGIDSYILAAPIHVNGGANAGDYYVAAAVYRGKDDQHFYLHEVAAQNMKKGQAESFKTPYEPQSGTWSDSTRPSIQSILEHLV